MQNKIITTPISELQDDDLVDLAMELAEKANTFELQQMRDQAKLELLLRLTNPPIRVAEVKIAKLQSALEGVLNTNNKEELDKLELVVRTMAAPDDDKAIVINAINALRYCLKDEEG